MSSFTEEQYKELIQLFEDYTRKVLVPILTDSCMATMTLTLEATGNKDIADGIRARHESL